MTSEKFEPKGLGLSIFNERYAWAGETWEDACERVADANSKAESNGNVVKFKERFKDQLTSGKFSPGGRFWYGSGRKVQQTLNCYVCPIEDSIEGWGKLWADVGTISARGGGVGVNFSPIRPRGYPISGMGGTTTGAVSVMKVVNAIGEEIKDGGGRRAALMFCLNLNHPDVSEFLQAKMVVGEISNANISIMIPEDMPTDEFVRMVRAKEDIPLMFNGLPDKLERTIRADELWDMLVNNAWEKGEPGLLNWYLVQKMNNIKYVRDLIAVNPCFTPDMYLLTDKGYKTFGELYELGSSVRVATDNRVKKVKGTRKVDWRGSKETTFRDASSVFLTKTQTEVVKVTTDGMPEVTCTPDHVFATERGMIEAQNLEQGDKILVALPESGSPIAHADLDDLSLDESLAAMAGLLAGDGTFTQKEHSQLAYLDFWGPDAERMASQCERWIEKAYEANYETGAGNYTSGSWKTRQLTAVRRDTVVLPDGQIKLRLGSTWLANALRIRFGFTKETKHVVPAEFMSNSRLSKFYLAGLFYADGTVNVGHGRKSISVRLGQSNKPMLDDVCLALHANGMRGRVVSRRPAGMYSLPDGRGGYKDYKTRENFEVILSGASRFTFASHVGFLQDPSKTEKLENANLLYPTKREHGWVKVRSVEPAGISDVFCVTEPENNMIIVNGLTTSNCGEQSLPKYGNCCLGHLVLPRFVAGGKFDWETFDESVRLAVRFLDNALDVADFPLPETEKAAKEERRIGLGVMGLHSMLLDLGMKYDSEEAFKFVDKLMNTMKNTAYDSSINLAIEKGPFPLYSQEILQGGFVKTLKPGLKHKIKEHGLRNCCLLTIAPTGTTSMVQGTTGGIEPVFSPVYIRRRRVVDGMQQEQLQETLVVSMEYLDHPSLVQGAYDIHPRAHMEMQKIVQKHVDAACSKTVNLPKDFPKEELSDLWLEYLPFLKGTTFYREGSREVGDSFEPMKHVPADQMQELVNTWEGELEYELPDSMDCASGICET